MLSWVVPSAGIHRWRLRLDESQSWRENSTHSAVANSTFFDSGSQNFLSPEFAGSKFFVPAITHTGWGSQNVLSHYFTRQKQFFQKTLKISAPNSFFQKTSRRGAAHGRRLKSLHKSMQQKQFSYCFIFPFRYTMGWRLILWVRRASARFDWNILLVKLIW